MQIQGEDNPKSQKGSPGLKLNLMPSFGGATSANDSLLSDLVKRFICFVKTIYEEALIITIIILAALFLFKRSQVPVYNRVSSQTTCYHYEGLNSYRPKASIYDSISNSFGEFNPRAFQITPKSQSLLAKREPEITPEIKPNNPSSVAGQRAATFAFAGFVIHRGASYMANALKRPPGRSQPEARNASKLATEKVVNNLMGEGPSPLQSSRANDESANAQIRVPITNSEFQIDTPRDDSAQPNPAGASIGGNKPPLPILGQPPQEQQPTASHIPARPAVRQPNQPQPGPGTNSRRPAGRETNQ